MRLTRGETAALADFVAALRGRFGDRVAECALFGSRSRGEAHEASDLDVLVVVDGLCSAERREIAHLAGDMLTRHGVMVAPFALSRARMLELRGRERRIAREIDRDAVAL